ncbi:hypothetical protein [Arthrobacter sp. ISL-30]|uniref:hypothetical protein n=1 Tax=Arthrobacter sp. ISL-30 TaxID=2819109 RepID=UPI001BE7EBF7|nr:hypothetical protein [Arthrobacter sp. ISL-30]MBT2511960.1 hypothetical protein [Arthrobacter sp. ISL-30]
MEYLAVLAPSVVVGLLFWFAMRSIFNADKSERQAEARAQQEADARQEARAQQEADARQEARARQETEMGKPEPTDPASREEK